MTPAALLHLATGTASSELTRDEQVALAWSFAEELSAVGPAAAYKRLRRTMPRGCGLGLAPALWLLVLAARHAYRRGDREAVAACFGVRGDGW
jgi:hypothetical protein